MNILAFDTCFGACSAAIADSNDDVFRILAHEEQLMQRGHAEALLPMIQRVLKSADVSLDAIDRVAVTIGPGTFTGVRVAIAAARATALATGIPLVGVGTLEAVAQTVQKARKALQGEFAIVRDARRGQVYLQTFKTRDGKAIPTMLDPVLCAPDHVLNYIPGSVAMAFGSGAPLVAWPGSATVETVATDMEVSAIAVAEIAVTREPDSKPVSPIYLRPPDAKPQSGFALQRQAR